MGSRTYDLRDIPVLNDAIDLAALDAHALPAAPAPAPQPAPPPAAPAPDAGAIREAIVEETLNAAARLTGEAARDIEILLFERVIGQLRAQLPDLVANAVRDHLPDGKPGPDEPHG